MNNLNAIHEYLISNKWIDLKYGQYMSRDGVFKIYVVYDEEESAFLVRSAILPLFDRWANSGSEVYLESSDDVISFLKGKYVLLACEELSAMLEEEIESNGEITADAYNTVVRIIDMVS